MQPPVPASATPAVRRQWQKRSSSLPRVHCLHSCTQYRKTEMRALTRSSMTLLSHIFSTFWLVLYNLTNINMMYPVPHKAHFQIVTAFYLRLCKNFQECVCPWPRSPPCFGNTCWQTSLWWRMKSATLFLSGNSQWTQALNPSIPGSQCLQDS